MDGVDERGIPQVGRKAKGNKYVALFGLGFAIVCVIAVGAHTVLDKLRHRNDGKEKLQAAERGLPDLTRDAFDAKHAPPPPAVAATPGVPAAADKSVMDLAERRKRAPPARTGAQVAAR
jgi:hypothetical protein